MEDGVQNLKSPKLSKSSDCQTFTNDIQIPCNICIYIATCEEELNYEHDIQTDLFFETDFLCDLCGKWCRSEADLAYHQKKHEQPIKTTELVTSKDGDLSLSFHFCEEQFETKRNLMIHTKKDHREKVKDCWKHSTGKCEFGDELCWFRHDENSKASNMAGLKCNVCGKSFENINCLFQHRKNDHIKEGQLCKNHISNTCKYGAHKCWFRHENENSIEGKEENSELTEKLFKMMEKFTERIMNLENQIAAKLN